MTEEIKKIFISDMSVQGLLAKAMTDHFTTIQGSMALDAAFLRNQTDKLYLRNSLEGAYLSGAQAMADIIAGLKKEHRPDCPTCREKSMTGWDALESGDPCPSCKGVIP